MRWQPGMNLSGLLNACNEMLAEPLPFEWSNQTPRFLLIFTGLYAVIALAASSEHRNTRPGEEHGSARWGNAKELNRRYRDTQGPNLLMTRNIALYAALVLVCCAATPVLAEGDPLTVVNNLSTFIFSIIRAIGLILLGWGIVQVGLSLQSHDPSQRSQGFLTLAGGIIITFAKEILDLIVGTGV